MTGGRKDEDGMKPIESETKFNQKNLLMNLLTDSLQYLQFPYFIKHSLSNSLPLRLGKQRQTMWCESFSAVLQVENMRERDDRFPNAHPIS